MKAELSGRFNLSPENVISVISVYVDYSINDEDFNELKKIAQEQDIHFNRTNVHGQVSGIVREKTMSARRTNHQKHGIEEEDRKSVV